MVPPRPRALALFVVLLAACGQSVLPASPDAALDAARDALDAAPIDAPPEVADAAPDAAPAPRALQLSARGATTCAVLEDGTARCWGSDRVPDDATRSVTAPWCMVDAAAGFYAAGPCRTRPWTLDAAGPVASVAVGGDFLCVRLASGAAQCAGFNDLGQLGNGDELGLSHRAPVSVQGLRGLRGLAAGGSHACAWDDANVWCWGEHTWGQLGVGAGPVDTSCYVDRDSVPCVRAPRPLGFAVRALALGDSSSVALTDSALARWGSGAVGVGSSATMPAVEQCAHPLLSGSTPCRRAPAFEAALAPAPSLLLAGGDTACALAGTSLRCWGSNAGHALGDATMDGRSAPGPALLSDAVTAALGGQRGCASRGAQGVWCWGTGEQVPGAPAPAAVPGGLDLRSLAVGYDHACGIDAQGAVWCWGSNRLGQLGDGSLTSSAAPVRVRF